MRIHILPSFPAMDNVFQPQQPMLGIAADTTGRSAGRHPSTIVTGATDRSGMPLAEQDQTGELSLYSMLEYALHYRSLRWSIIPQTAGAKSPCVKWKRYQDCHPTADEISSWWSYWPDAGICLILGEVSGIVAVDSDSADAHKVFVERLGGVPHTLTVRSGSRKAGKYHYYFVAPGFRTAATYRPWHPQLEFRGTGGYLVVPPSVHPSGNRYEWVDPTVPIAAMPSVLATAWQANPRFVRPEISAQPASRREFGRSSISLRRLLLLPRLSRFTARWLDGEFAQDSNWNMRLFAAAADLAGLGLTIEIAEPHLLRGARPNTAEDEQMARNTIRSAFSNARVPLTELGGG